MNNPLHDLLKSIQNFFHAGVHDIAVGVSFLAHSIEQNGGAVLMSAAAAGVAAAESTGGNGKDKFAAAQAAVISALETAGIPVVLNAVNGAIEAAVAQHRANVAAAA